jgi:hypothetical protein
MYRFILLLLLLSLHLIGSDVSARNGNENSLIFNAYLI